MRRNFFWYVLLTIVCLGTSEAVAQERQSFASSAVYQSMLKELARDYPRPSRIAAAGELLQGTQVALAAEENESSQELRIETKFWRLDVDKKPFRLTFANKLTGVLWRLDTVDSPTPGLTWRRNTKATTPGPASFLERIQKTEKKDGNWTLEGVVTGSSQPVRIQLTLLSPNALGISFDASAMGREVQSEFHISAEAPFFGLGEQFARINQEGLRISLHPNDLAWIPGHLWDYMSIPFVFSVKGNGVYFDTALNCVFDSTKAQQPGFGMQFDGPSVDMYLIAGKGPKEVVETYAAITGRPKLPPPWAFGVWHNALQGSASVLKIAQDLRSAKIPVSALWVSDLMDHRDNMGWPLWTAGYYGPPGQFAGDLHKLGFKVLVYLQPYVRSLLLPYPLTNPEFSDGLRSRFLVTDSGGKPRGPVIEPDQTGNVDFTNPDAVQWWQGKIQRVLVDYNFDGWMEDFGEWVKDDHLFTAGKSGRTMASLYPLFYHKISYEIAHQIKADAVEFDRSGAPGSQAFTTVLWGGDQTPDWAEDNGYPSAVKAGITAGLSGFAVWGPDILSSGQSKELFIRWTEFGALSPIMRDHLWDKPKFGVDLWFDAQTTDIFRKFARLHVSLFPYLYSFAQEASRTGLPIMRHPMLEWPDDPRTYDAQYEYLLGDRILVAPVVKEGARSRSLYLPKGSWVDFWTGKIAEGGSEATVAAPLEEIPMLVRAGSVLPFAGSDIDTLASDLAGTQYKTLDDNLIWRVFPSPTPSTESFTLYDGTKASVDQNSSRIIVKGESSTIHQYEVIVNVGHAPDGVLLSDQRLVKLDAAGYRARKTGWLFDEDTKMLHALFLTTNFTLQVANHGSSGQQ
jgi:alpha-glucosidase (family GH31 glycosyl hydrolase)